MKNIKDNVNTDDISYIDPVLPNAQVEQQDPYFQQMGDDQNTKFIEQKVDGDRPKGSDDGEYPHDDENADERPPKEEILQAFTEENDTEENII